MKKTSFFSNFIKASALAATLSLAVGQNTPDYVIEFQNLPQDQRIEFSKLAQEANRLFTQQRVIEAFDTIAKAESILAGHPAVSSIKAACYIELRDFEKAAELFQETLKLDDKNPGNHFNLGEVYFVEGSWAKSKKSFVKVMELLAEQPNNGTYQLAEFKNYIADKKLGNKEAAEAMEAKYDFTSESPIYYYVNFVKDFEAGNEAKANKWLKSASRVFRQPGALNSWQDTLIESDYIKSYLRIDEEATEAAAEAGVH